MQNNNANASVHITQSKCNTKLRCR